MRNTRLPVSLNEMTCTITETVSNTKRPPTMASTISCLTATATAPSAPPSGSEPVSPMNTMAGGALYQRKPRPAPIRAASNTASSPVPFVKNFMVPFGIAFVAVGGVVIAGAANAVNFTDGLDGLAIVPVMIAAATFILIAYLVGNVNFAKYLELI